MLIFPSDLESRRHEPNVDIVLRAQQNLFATARNSIIEQRNILNGRIEQLHLRIDGYRQQVLAAEEQLRLSRDELAGLQELYDDGLLTNSQLATRKREIARVDGDLGVTLASIAQTEEAIQSAEVERTLLVTQFAERNARELEETRSNIIELRSNLRGAEDLLYRTEITAPVSGKIVEMQYFTVGATISPRQAIMTIVPNNDQLIIKAKINPLDIDVVYPGLNAEVRLTAFRQRTTPTVPATLDNISADLLEDPATRQAYYEGTVILDHTEAQKYKLYPGMPADVMIRLNDRTFLDYLLAPLEQSFSRAFIDD